MMVFSKRNCSTGDKVELYSAISLVASSTVPWELEANVLAVYLRSDMTCGSSDASIQLPTPLVLELAPPAKESEATLHLTSSHPVILPTIFPGEWACVSLTGSQLSYRNIT